MCYFTIYREQYKRINRQLTERECCHEHLAVDEDNSGLEVRLGREHEVERGEVRIVAIRNNCVGHGHSVDLRCRKVARHCRTDGLQYTCTNTRYNLKYHFESHLKNNRTTAKLPTSPSTIVALPDVGLKIGAWLTIMMVMPSWKSFDRPVLSVAVTAKTVIYSYTASEHNTLLKCKFPIIKFIPFIYGTY